MRLVLGVATALTCLAVNVSAATCPVLDSDTLRCQSDIGRAGGVYIKSKMKAVQQCLNKIQSGDLTGDPVTVCRGTAGVPPTDATTATKIARAEGRVASILGGKCTDAIVASLNMCDVTVSGLTTCLIADHWQLTDDAIAEEYGAVVPGNTQEQECQAAVGKEAGKYLSARAKAIAHCIDVRNKRVCGSTEPTPHCLTPRAGGPGAENAAANKIDRARVKMLQKIGEACVDTEVTALDACADTVATLDDCLLCSHDAAVNLLIANQYAAVHAADAAGPSLQSIADAANGGDTIFLRPGTYTQSMTLKDSGLSLIGLKTCDTGARAILENPGAVANGIVSCGSLTSGCTDIADDLLFQGFEVNNFEANDIFTVGADGVTYRDMVTRGPGTNPGTEYGLFPVLSRNVLVEDSVVTNVRDAGIYVGQSIDIIVRNNEVFGNVAGIEIENSANAEVYGNYAHDNTAGILVFKLVLPIQYSNCHNVHDNIVENNNGVNYGSGLVGDVPQGTGMLILSNDASIFQNNTVTGNDTFGIVLTDQYVLNLLFEPDPFPTPSEDALSENNFFVGNTQTGNGTNPDPAVPAAFASDGAIVITDGTGNCGDDLPPPGVSYFWNAMPDCPVPPTPPGCPFVPGPTTTSTTATSTTTTTSIGPNWSEIQAVFATACATCHTSSSSGGLTGLADCNTGYANLVNVPSATAGVTLDRVEPSDATLSFLMHKLDGTQASVGDTTGVQMPAFQAPLSIETRDAVRTWINNGAVNDCP